MENLMLQNLHFSYSVVEAESFVMIRPEIKIFK